MTSLRLTFLYPHLFRLIKTSVPVAQTARQCCQRSASHRACFATTSRKQQRFVERHGKAVEPFLMPGKAKKNSKVFVPKSSPAPIQNDNAKESNARGGAEESPSSGTIEPMGQEEASSTAPLSKETQVAAHIPDNVGDSGQGTTSVDQGLASLESQVRPPDGTRPTKDGPLEKILQTEPPAEGTQADGLNIPHLHPPPFIHNFDSYTLVKEVEKGGFTPGQAITAMKGVRVLLANNLELAKKGLVSKSDVENQSYLFRAACSELRIEIQNTRKANDEKMRRERTLLQHEFDTLSQKLSQELSALKDELTGMFNDRKMAVKMKQREMDSAIQQLSYKITVLLNSDSKSEVEGLRWVLTRRSVLAIVFMALMVLSSLRYASYRAHEDELERKRQEKLKEVDAARQAHGKDGEGIASGETQSDVDGAGEKRDLPAGTAAESMSAS